MFKKPKASFVIPVYNGQGFLAEAIQSCLDQEYKEIEVIVVDDGSVDHTESVIDHYAKKDERVIKVKIEKNAGRSNARNTGIDVATGSVILMNDADDVSHKERAGIVMRFFRKNTGISLMYGNFNIIDAVGKVYGYIKAERFDWGKAKEAKLMYIGHSSMAVRKDVFDKIRYTNGEFSNLAIDDWKFQFDCAKAGLKFGFVNRLLCDYRKLTRAPRDEKRILELKQQCLA